MSTAAQIDGVDISHWQSGELDLAKARKAGVKFIYHKATEYTKYTDPNYEKRRKEAASAGIPFGAYHFARPRSGSASSEAKHFLAYAKPQIGDMSPVLDLESNPDEMSQKDLTAWVGTFVAEVAKAGFKTIIYTPYNLNKNFGCALWVARYSNSMNAPRVPSPWKTWDIWQFSNGEYGNPNTVPGIGHCDINTLAKDHTVNDFVIEKPEKKTKKATRLTIQHSSLEVFDTDREKKTDARKVFSTGNPIICGTEAGPGAGPMQKYLKRQAKKKGYFFYRPGKNDCWIAIRRDFVTKGTRPSWDYKEIFKNAKASGDPNGPYSNRGIVSATVQVDGIGTLSVGTAHFLTKGRTPAQTPPGKFNHYAMNSQFIDEVGAWAEEKGKGSALVFFTADTNIPDNKMDVFRGHPLTTAWDELDTHPNTGHGNIDVIASYDKDGRVKAKSARVVPLNLNSDHKTIEATYRIKLQSSC